MQTLWIVLCIPLSAFLSLQMFDSMWIVFLVSIPLWGLLTWVGMSLISLADRNHRMAAKFGVRIENVPFYQKLLNEMAEDEENDLASVKVPEEVTDPEEWRRFCAWQMFEMIREIERQPKDETIAALKEQRK